MGGGLYDAATLERWDVVNRVLPDSELEEKSLRFAQRLVAGPTRAHHATKRIVRAFLDYGVRGADDVTAATGARLFETNDLQQAVESFLAGGPGKATFEGSLNYVPPLAPGSVVPSGSARADVVEHAGAVVRIRRRKTGRAHAGRGNSGAYRNRQVVQRRKGLRLHHARRRRP